MLCNLFYPIFQYQFHTVIHHLFMENLRHVMVKRRHDLVCGLNHRNMLTGHLQIFCHFDTDKPAPYHSYIFHSIGIQIIFQSHNIFHISNRKHMGAMNTDNTVRQNRACSGRQNQNVVGLFIVFARLQILHFNDLFVSANLCYLTIYPCLNVILPPKSYRVHHDQSSAASHYPAEVKRKGTVRKGNIVPPLQHNDLGILVQTTYSGRHRSATGYPTDYYNFFCHFCTSSNNFWSVLFSINYTIRCSAI